MLLLTASLPFLASAALAATYPAVVQGDGPLAYYRFNESTERPSVNVNSGSLGAAGNATNINVRTTSGAIVGSRNPAAYFDSTARTIVPWNAELNPDATVSFTIEAWFLATSDKVAGSFVGPAPIMNRYSGAVKNRQGWVYFQRNPDERPYANGQTAVGWNFRSYKGSGSSVGIDITSGVPYKLGQWQHVVTVWQAEDQTAIMYVDGVEAKRQTYTGVVYEANTDDHGDEQVNGAAGLAIGSYNNTEAGSNPFRGGIDEVAFYNKALTAEQIAAHYENARNAARTVSYDALVQADGPVGYWRLDDNTPGGDIAVNSGLLQQNLPAVNTADVRHAAQGALAGSNDGSYSYHRRNGSSTTSMPWHADMNPEATQPFTFEAWFRPTTDLQNPGASPVNNRYVKSGNRTGWVIFQRAPNSTYAGVSGNEGVGWNFRFYTGAGGSGRDLVSNKPYTVGEWQHVVVTWDGQTTGTMYINGEEAVVNRNILYAANVNPPLTAEGLEGDPADAADLAIGSYNRASGLGSNPFEGDIDEVAFYKVMLTPDQIRAHYEAGIDNLNSETYANLVLTAPYEIAAAAETPAPAQALQPVSYFRFNEKAPAPVVNSAVTGEAADGSVVAAAAPVDGPQGASGYVGFEEGNKALAVVGKAHASLNNPSVLAVSGQVTVEAWIKPDATQGTVARIVSHGPPTLSSYPAEPVREGAVLIGNELALRINGGAEYQFSTTDGTDFHGVIAPIPAGDLGGDAWVHLVGTFDGSRWALYRNGVELAASADPNGAIAVDNANWAIGSTGNGWAEGYAGGIDEVAIYGTALTPAQVAAHYAAASGVVATIGISRSGADVTLTWSGGTLQESATVNGTYTDVAGAVSPLTLTAPKATRFYRLK